MYCCATTYNKQNCINTEEFISIITSVPLVTQTNSPALNSLMPLVQPVQKSYGQMLIESQLVMLGKKTYFNTEIKHYEYVLYYKYAFFYNIQSKNNRNHDMA